MKIWEIIWTPPLQGQSLSSGVGGVYQGQIRLGQYIAPVEKRKSFETKEKAEAFKQRIADAAEIIGTGIAVRLIETELE